MQKCIATDAEAGVYIHCSGNKSKKCVKERALESLIIDLYNRGLFKPVKVPSDSADDQSIDIPLGKYGFTSLVSHKLKAF